MKERQAEGMYAYQGLIYNPGAVLAFFIFIGFYAFSGYAIFHCVNAHDGNILATITHFLNQAKAFF